MARLAVILSFAMASAASAAITSLTVFGDSLSDTGTIAAILDALGEPSLTPPPYYEGRFSNGPIYAERLGFAVEPAFPFGGTNYAAGGALTTTHVGGPILTGLSFRGQVDRFRVDSGGSADPSGLFIVWIGGNDVRHAALAGDAAAGLTIIDDALEVVELAILDLQAMGARRMIVPNLPDFGRTPEFAADPSLATALSERWNSGLAELLARRGGPEVRLFDANTFLASLVDDPDRFGFTNTTDQALLNLDQDPDEFIFWDDIHPTARVHELLANEMRLLVPEPTPVALVLLGAALLAVRRRR